MIGFGRIGQLVAKRAQSFEMEVVGYDKFVSPERFRELGVEGVDTLDELYARADLVTLHLPKTPETEELIDAEAIAKMRDGVRIVNCARGDAGRPRRARAPGSSRERSAGAALDVFPRSRSPSTRCSSATTSSSRPHLGASTAEAQDRAGVVTAEQVRAALTGGVVTNAVNIAAVAPEAMEALAPFVPLCEKLGRLAQGLADGSADRVEVEFRGRIAEHDTRLLGIAVLVGILSGHTEEPVNLVNAPAIAEERGIELIERKDLGVRGLHRAGHGPDRRGRSRSPAPASGRATSRIWSRVWGQSFYMPFADHLAIFRYADQPGMIGRVGTAFGEHGVNIVSAAVGAEPAASARR